MFKEGDYVVISDQGLERLMAELPAIVINEYLSQECIVKKHPDTGKLIVYRSEFCYLEVKPERFQHVGCLFESDYEYI